MYVVSVKREGQRSQMTGQARSTAELREIRAASSSRNAVGVFLLLW